MLEERAKMRGYPFTCYVMDLSFIEHLIDDYGAKYVICGEEVCPTSGRLHWQSYVYFRFQRHWNSVKSIMNGRHFEKQKGSIDDAIEYCKKDGKWFDYGKTPSQGKRNDISAIKGLVTDGSESIAEIVMNHCTSLQHIHVVEKVMKYLQPKRPIKKLKVFWLYGPPGTGKSQFCYDQDEDVFSPISEKWWDGYNGEKRILIDDFRPNWCSFDKLLKLLDKYPLRIEAKGTSMQAQWNTVYITTPHNIDNTFINSEENLAQLHRRVTDVIEFERIDTEPEAMYLQTIHKIDGEITDNGGQLRYSGSEVAG